MTYVGWGGVGGGCSELRKDVITTAVISKYMYIWLYILYDIDRQVGRCTVGGCNVARVPGGVLEL